MIRLRWESPLRNVRVATLLVGLVAALVFVNSIGNEFAYDDNHIVRENTSIHSLDELPSAMARPYWPGPHGKGLGLWRPVMTGVLGLEWIVSNGTPAFFHTVNVLAHAVVSGLVVVFLASLIPLPAAFFGGLVFAVHPVHVEAVANVVGLAEVLATGLLLIACIWHVKAGERVGPLRILGMTLIFSLAFLTKESAVTFLGLLFLLDAARMEIGWKELPGYLRRYGFLYGAMILASAIILYARYQVLGSVARPFAPLGGDLLEEIPRIWTVAGLWPHYVRLLFFPADLVVDYAPAVVSIYHSWNVVNIGGALLAFLFLGVGWLSWRQGPMLPSGPANRAVGFAVVWFVISMSPVSNFLFLSGVLLAERTFYLPSVGFAAGIGWVLMSVWERRRRLFWPTLVLVLGLLSLRSYTRNPTWKDNLTVFDTLLNEHPESGRGQWVMGDVYFQAGQVGPSLQRYRLAVGIIGGHYTLLAEVARRLMGAKMYEQAEFLLLYAYEDRPEFSTAPALLAVVHADQGHWQEAESWARRALEREASDGIVHHVLSSSLAAQERFDEALVHREEAIAKGEGRHWEQWLWLAQLRVQVGDTAAALVAIDSAEVRATEAPDLEQLEAFRDAVRDFRNPR
jgi:cytochrome c-type biogenesis protein CcmH/NrfG